VANQLSDETTNAVDPAPVIQAIVNDVAQMEVDPEQSFFDLGLDSIMMMDIYNRIVDELGDVLDLFRLFENPSVNECAAVIREWQE
jgi:aryl carrier-like protein